MEVRREQSGRSLTLTVNGRLDGYWADHLAKELAEVLREGVHEVQVDLAGVSYMSSAGIGTLVEAYKEFDAVQGSFRVVNASAQVRTLLTLTKLDTILIGQTGTAPATAKPPAFREVEHRGATFEVFDLIQGAVLRCVTVGDASLLEGCQFGAEDCHKVDFPASTFAVGLGAFGNDFDDCRSRFGEFMAVAGAAAYLPADGTNVPDYMLAAETFVPELQVLYCAKAEGRFPHLARFEAKKEIGAVKLSDLIDAGFEITRAEAIGVVVVAESAGLLGASLRRSPVFKEKDSNDSAPFGFPAIRQWLSYSPERTYGRSLSLVAGIAAKHVALKDKTCSSMLRPLGTGAWPVGHFHATVFPYRPIKKGSLDLKSTVASLFETGGVQSVMHLLNDTREINGAGESEFVRGACWFAPIQWVAT